MIRLEARQERAVSRVLGAIAMTVNAVERGRGCPGCRVRLGGAQRPWNGRARQHALRRDTGARLGMRTTGGRLGRDQHRHERDARGSGHKPGRLPAHSASRVASTSAP